MIDAKIIFDFLKKQETVTQKNIAKLNAPKFLKKRSLRSKVNYLKSFELIVKQSENATQYIYKDTHYYDTVRKVFLQFAKDKNLSKSAGFAIGTKKSREGVTNTLDVFIADRRSLFRTIDKFIDTTLINMYIEALEQQFGEKIQKQKK